MIGDGLDGGRGWVDEVILCVSRIGGEVSG